MAALCLAARIGTEVKAFQDAGCFAVGIDLNPGDRNNFVLTGDFDDIQLPADSIDLVYTNSIDHAFDVAKMLTEVRRVLRRGVSSFWKLRWAGEPDRRLETMRAFGGIRSRTLNGWSPQRVLKKYAERRLSDPAWESVWYGG